MKDVFNVLLDKSWDILCIGCGNAPMMPDMVKDGYKNMMMTDLSPVVIKQMQETHPGMSWGIMDALNTGLQNTSVKCVVDKSLIDTLMCCSNSLESLKQFYNEMYRILEINGLLITFSLHKPDDIKTHFEGPKDSPFHWKTDYYRIKSSRWDRFEQKRTSVAHTLVVCQKYPQTVRIPTEPLLLPGVLSKEDEEELHLVANEIIEASAFKAATVDNLRDALDKALADYQEATALADAEMEGGMDQGEKSILDDSSDSGSGSDDKDEDDDENVDSPSKPMSTPSPKILVPPLPLKDPNLVVSE